MTARPVDVARTLLSGYRFAGVRTVIEWVDITPATRERVCRLAEAGSRVLDLDAEDFDRLSATDGGLPAEVATEIGAAQFPRTAAGGERGSLRSLDPLYRLMLEALDVRWQRGEPLHVVVLLHLIAEYLPLLAWQSTLGNAGDPIVLTDFVQVPGSRWGTADKSCDHNASQRSAAVRLLSIADVDDNGWRTYLDKFHSRVSHALGKCGTHPLRGRPRVEGVCRRPCPLWTRLDETVAADLNARVHLARMYAASPAVALRHHAPAGHFFGVPSTDEISEAWQRTWARMIREWRTKDNPLRNEPPSPARGLPDEALPGMAALVSAVAGRAVAPSGILAGIREEIERELTGPT